MDEFGEKLSDKFNLTSSEVLDAVSDVLSFLNVVVIPHELQGICSDPKDDMVLECVLVGMAAYVVTGDRHLLALKEYRGMQILRASEFLRLMSLSSSAEETST